MTRNGNGIDMPAANEVLLVTSGDLRLSANQACWPAQRDMEEKLTAAFAHKGIKLVRAHAYDEALKHGFLSSQRAGMDVFMNIHPEARLVFATAAWQYSHHVLPGLRSHRGPILTVANWSGQWPGLVGLLNLNGSLVKAGKKFSTIWSKDFTDGYFVKVSRNGCAMGKITHDLRMSNSSMRQSSRRRAGNWAPRWPRTCSTARPSWESSMKAAWECTTPSSTMNC